MRLRYVTDTVPGFTRKKGFFSFVYLDEHRKKIRNTHVLTRIRSLGIPPAYADVWICSFENGHIQATAIDARGRKQYFYHPDWTAHQQETKFHRMDLFARTLSRVRRRVARDLALRGMPKDKVLAALVRLLDTTYIRIGNESYAEENHSFGLTTLRDQHVHGVGEHMRFIFRGKSGVVHEVPLKDARLRKIIAACHDLPGQELFAYLDAEGKAHDVSSEDVNAYLKEISQEEITAKDFRTWHATVIVAEYLWKHPLPTKKQKAHLYVRSAVQRAARALGNTAAVCKKSYVHPLVLTSYGKGDFVWKSPSEALRKKYAHLHVQEIALLKLLEDI
jgi:DNA topoisomerase-1